MEGPYGSTGIYTSLGRYVGELRYGQTGSVLPAFQEVVGRFVSTEQEGLLDYSTPSFGTP